MKLNVRIVRYYLLLLLCIAGFNFSRAQTKVVHLYIGDTMVNFTGKQRMAITVNGSIPGPELHFTEGDTAEIYVHNTLGTETSVHWHGLILPNEMDGVPYLTTAPIKAKQTARYTFPLVQHGTYWYHSHTGLQEQIGLYGAFIIHEKQEKYSEKTLILSDWSDEMPMQIDRSLHAATDWYNVRKGAAQSYGEAIRDGYLGTKLLSEWKRMHAMDVSDVFYDAYLVNGRRNSRATEFAKGDTVRLRVINGSSSTYYWLQFAGGPVQVIANDGADVVPVEVDRLIVGVSETYDVLVILPENKTFEFRATSEDRIGKASYFLGAGDTVFAPTWGRLHYFEGMIMMNDMMRMDGNMKSMKMHMQNQIMDMNTVMYPEYLSPTDSGSHPYHYGIPKTLNYNMLRSPENTVFPDTGEWKEFNFTLTGNMNRYVWAIDNKTVSEAGKIWINPGDKIRIILYNNTMMRHPMHLHGHFFRVRNEYGDFSPLKTVLDIMPMERDTIEFLATESGDWYFHCHILYHMMSGMGRIFSYEGSSPNPTIEEPKKSLRKVYADDRMYHLMGEIDIASNGSDGEIMYGNTRNVLSAEWRVGWMGDYETETHISRFFGKNQFFSVYAGTDFRSREGGETNTKDNRQVACIGLNYVLPGLIESDLRLDHTGKVRFQLHRDDLALTQRIRMRGMWNSDGEFMVGSSYILTKYWSASLHYDSDMKWGLGMRFTY
ncbi:MAG: copper oxidase [Bacteroidetes bacterium]|nr:MAG: copper oxidase [Bacteroidota bacterium]